MSAPMDVLAVMQRTESCARLYYQRPDAYGRETPADEQRRLDEEAQQARAVVAELVEAAKSLDSVLPRGEGFRYYAHRVELHKFRAAIAKFGGAA